MDECEDLPRVLAVDEDRGWQARRTVDQSLELDLGPICLWVTEEEFAVITRLTTLATDAGDTEGVLASAGSRRIVHRCPHTGVFSLLFDRTMLRFYPHELAAFAGLCRQVRVALESPGAPAEVWFSRN